MIYWSYKKKIIKKITKVFGFIFIFFIFFIFFIIFSFNPSPLYSIDSKDLNSFLSSIDTKPISIEIIQHKYVSILDKTFSTYSLARFEKDKGFIFIHNDDKFISTKEKYCFNSDPPKLLKDLPYYSDIKSLIDSLMQSDTKALESIFDIKYGKYLQLSPKNSRIKKWISKINVSIKNNRLDVIEIKYQNKDKITLQIKPTGKKINDKIDC